MFEGDTALLNLLTTVVSMGIIAYLAVLLITNVGNILFNLFKIGIFIVIIIFIIWAFSFSYKGSSLANISQQQEIQNLKDKVSKIYNDIITNYDLADSELMNQTENLFSQGTTNSEGSSSLQDDTGTQENEIKLTSFDQLIEWEPGSYNLEQIKSDKPSQDTQSIDWEPSSYNLEQIKSDKPIQDTQLTDDKTPQELVLETSNGETFIPTNTTYTPMFNSEPTLDKDKVVPEVSEPILDKDKVVPVKKPMYFTFYVQDCKGEPPETLDYKSSPKKLVYLTTVTTLNNPNPNKIMLTNAYNDFKSSIKPTMSYCGETYIFEYMKYYKEYRKEGKTLNSFLRYEKTNETKNGLPATYAYLHGNWYRKDR